MTPKTARRHPRAARLDGREWRRVCAFAAGHSVPPAEGMRRLVLYALESSEGIRRSVAADLEQAIERLLGILDLVGPAVVGLPHLLAYWAIRDEGNDKDAAEFVAEFTENAAALWADALQRHGVDPRVLAPEVEIDA